MAKSILVTHGSKDVNLGAFSINGALSTAQESRTASGIRTAGTLSNLSSFLPINTYTGTTTIVVRLNNSDTSLT